MNEGDGDRTFADRGCDTLDIARAHVADREHAGQARLEQVRSAGERPLACASPRRVGPIPS